MRKPQNSAQIRAEREDRQTHSLIVGVGCNVVRIRAGRLTEDHRPDERRQRTIG